MKYIFLILTVWSAAAGADILFLNLNGQYQEIQAAQAAARKANQKLIVYPQPRSAAQEAAYSALQRQMGEQLRIMSSSTSTREQQNQADQEFLRLSREQQKLGVANYLDRPGFEAVLGDLEKSGAKVSSLIISGHDGNGDFFGNQGRLHAQDIKDAFREYPNLAGQVESLFLAGCYTSTPGSLENNWKPSFANLKGVFGYDHSGPAGDKIPGHTYLKNYILKGPALLKEANQSKIQRTARSIIPTDLTSNAAICLPGGKFVKRNETLDVAELKKRCDDYVKKIEELNPTIECYVHAKTGCENPPEDTRAGPLREYYNIIQNIEHCKLDSTYRIPLTIDGESLIRIMYFKNVKKNFWAQYKDDIARLREPLIEAGLDAESADKLTRLDQLSRKEILELVSKINQLSTKIFDTEKQFTGAALARRTAQGLADIFSRGGGMCVPFGWVETQSSAKSECALDAKIGSKALTAANYEGSYTYYDRQRSALIQDANKFDAWKKADPVSDEAIAQSFERSRHEQLNLQIQLAGEKRGLARLHVRAIDWSDNIESEVARSQSKIAELENKIREKGLTDYDRIKKDPVAYLRHAAKGAAKDLELRKARIDDAVKRFDQVRPLTASERKYLNDAETHLRFLNAKIKDAESGGFNPIAKAELAKIVSSQMRVQRLNRLEAADQRVIQAFDQQNYCQQNTCREDDKKWVEQRVKEAIKEHQAARFELRVNNDGAY